MVTHVIWRVVCFSWELFLFPRALLHRMPTNNSHPMTGSMKKHFSVCLQVYSELNQPRGTPIIFMKMFYCDRFYVFIWNCVEAGADQGGLPLFSCRCHKKSFLQKNEMRSISPSYNYIMGRGKLKFSLHLSVMGVCGVVLLITNSLWS